MNGPSSREVTVNLHLQCQAWPEVSDIHDPSTYCERCAGEWRGHWLAGSPCHSPCRRMACPQCGSSRGGTVQWTGQTQHHSTGTRTSSLHTHELVRPSPKHLPHFYRQNQILRHQGNVIWEMTLKPQAICNILGKDGWTEE